MTRLTSFAGDATAATPSFGADVSIQSFGLAVDLLVSLRLRGGDGQCWGRSPLREVDAVLLLVELVRIHQRHWDEFRRREIPSFEQFRADIGKLVEAARTFEGQATALLEVVRGQPPAHRASWI